MNITTLALTARLLLSPSVTDDGVAEADSLGTEGVIDRKLSQSGGAEDACVPAHILPPQWSFLASTMQRGLSCGYYRKNKDCLVMLHKSLCNRRQPATPIIWCVVLV